MTIPLVECIANYSEARRQDVVAAIAEAIRSVTGVRILDRHSDTDHNRTVITFIGPPDAIEEAAFRSIQKAAQLIDLNHHQGTHPRIGATDVVPFVPISGVSMDDCVAVAKRLGKRVGAELQIPVYLYEEAATRPERKNLENIRRGQYEALKEEIGVKPERDPDFGPAQVGPAGATVIGARHPLIAYNVYLTTDDIRIAKEIARVVRHSSGGLRYVKALGMLVDGRAQVSMNLTNYRETSLARAVEMIRREAARFGVAIHHSELVGLIPEEALVDAAVWYLQLDQFKPDQILERKLYAQEAERSEAHLEFGNFLDKLAEGSAAPGGGAAAAFSAAAAAALIAMAARLTIGKKKYQAVEAEMRAILDETEALRADLIQDVTKDSEAFEAVMSAFRLPKDTELEAETRRREIENATYAASLAPLEVAQKAVRLLELASQVIAAGNINTICDAGTAAALAYAGLEGALLNIRTNAQALHDTARAEPLFARADSLEQQAHALKAQCHAALTQRGGPALG